MTIVEKKTVMINKVTILQLYIKTISTIWYKKFQLTLNLIQLQYTLAILSMILDDKKFFYQAKQEE